MLLKMLYYVLVTAGFLTATLVMLVMALTAPLQ